MTKKSVEALIELAATTDDSMDAMRFSQAAQNSAAAMVTLSTALSMTPQEDDDEKIKRMADRFLSWRLPKDFNPDNGIGFAPVIYAGMSAENQAAHWPSGTNLFTIGQAESMVRHMLSDL